MLAINAYGWTALGFAVAFVFLAFPGLMHVVFRHGHQPSDDDQEGDQS